jgi:hypothetical protein
MLHSGNMMFHTLAVLQLKKGTNVTKSCLLDTANMLIVVFVLQHNCGRMFLLLMVFLIRHHPLGLLLCLEMNIGFM